MRKTLLLKSAIIVFANIILANHLRATTYYISPSGSDGNIGTTPLTAWQTISKIDSINIQPGDSILFEGGQTFYGHIMLDANDGNDSNNVVTFSSYGTGKAIINSADTIGFYAYNTQGFTISNLVFEGSGMNTNSTDGIFIYADLDGDVKFTNEVFSHIEVLNYGGIGLEIGAWPYTDNGNTGFKNILLDSVHVHDVLSSGIEAWGFFDSYHVGWSHNNMIIRNTLVHDVPGFSSSGWKGSGIVIAEVDSGVMEHCVAHDNGSGNTACGGPVGIWAWDCNNVTIQYCESYHNSSGSGCDGGGFDFDGGETNSIMQYNYSHDNDGNGFLLGQFAYARPWFNNIVRYNISENDGRTNSGGISLFKGDETVMSGVLIYQNTIYVSPSDRNTDLTTAFNITDWVTGIDSILVCNNIFQTSGSKDSVALINIPAGYSANFAGNLYWASGDSLNIIYQGVTYTDLDAWRTATGNEIINSSPTGIFADPLLSNAGNGGVVYPNSPDQINAYMLPSNSPAVNSGLDLMTLFGINSGSRDFFDNPAPIGTPDIGAYESSFTTATRPVVNNKSSIYIYPVPAADMLHFRSSSFNSGDVIKASVTNILGETIMTSLLSSPDNREYTISIPTLPSGIYFLQLHPVGWTSNGVKTENSSTVKKFIKE